MSGILETRALTKTYESDGSPVEALRGIDPEVAAGELVAIMGPSGCGKSTLLHLLGGLDRPTSGEVILEGRRVDRMSEAQWAVVRRRQVGYMFQAFNLIMNLTVADNIEIPALIAGVSASEARRRRQALLDQLGVGDKGDVAPGRLSGGQQQRVALARALVNQPRVLLADEPTGNLDSRSAQEVLEIVREHNRAGQTIVLVTHDARVAAAADRVIRMRDGLIVGETRIGSEERSRDVLSRLLEIGVS